MSSAAIFVWLQFLFGALRVKPSISELSVKGHEWDK